MARARTTKGVAKRVELTYYRRMHPFRRWWRILCFGAAGAGLLWLLVEAVRGDQRLYTSGTVSIAHQMIDADCERCHALIPRPAAVPAAADGTAARPKLLPAVHTGGRFFRKVSDGACLVCHDGSVHHETQTVEPPCAECHVEHQGRTTLVRFKDRHCVSCHDDLKAKTKGGTPKFEARVVRLAEHPEFALFRKNVKDTAAIKLSHETHLKEGLPAGGGKRVTLGCEACHKEDAAGQYLLPIVYETHCAQCHPLEVADGLVAPHEQPEIVRGFLLARLAGGKGGAPGAAPAPADKPAETAPATEPDSGGRRRRGASSLRELVEQVQLRWRGPAVELAQRQRGGAAQESPAPAAPAPAAEQPGAGEQPAGRRRGGPAEPAPAAPAPAAGRGAAALAAVADAEKELFTGRQGCKYCHTLEEGEQGLPKIAPPKIPSRWLPHSSFSHRVHRPLDCVACHAGAPKSVETADVLMPKMQVCQDCHRAGGGARDDCVECHLYHDRAKERPAQGPFTTVPEFVSGKPRAAAPAK
jgi:hypothetical protein